MAASVDSSDAAALVGRHSLRGDATSSKNVYSPVEGGERLQHAEALDQRTLPAVLESAATRGGPPAANALSKSCGGVAECRVKQGASFLKESIMVGITHVTSDDLKRSIIKCTAFSLEELPAKHVLRIVNGSKGAFFTTGSGTIEATCLRIVDELTQRLHNHGWCVATKALLLLRLLILEGSTTFRDVVVSRRLDLFDVRRLKPYESACPSDRENHVKYHPLVVRLMQH